MYARTKTRLQVSVKQHWDLLPLGHTLKGSQILLSDVTVLEEQMIDTNLVSAEWRKAARSAQGNGGCVEIAGDLRDVTGIRDSARPQDGAHVTSKAAFAAFLAAAKAGHYDLDRPS